MAVKKLVAAVEKLVAVVENLVAAVKKLVAAVEKLVAVVEKLLKPLKFCFKLGEKSRLGMEIRCENIRMFTDEFGQNLRRSSHPRKKNVVRELM